ncbi:MAG TPA: riboflavin synthase [Actinobacteria bacterium]|nr:riboflavin synthase [Actinomycetota bacterium]
MFTGIIEELGRVQSIRKTGNSRSIAISASKTIKDAQIGDSIAVNGICLTVTKLRKDVFEADIMPETLKKTNLRVLRRGEAVNLERALKFSDRIGGHIVSGHVDGLGKIISKKSKDGAIILTIKTKPQITQFLVSRGSVAVDGISLTVVDVAHDRFSVSIIPHTAETTTLGIKKSGATLNIETDAMGKYVERLIKKSEKDISRKTFIKYRLPRKEDKDAV